VGVAGDPLCCDWGVVPARQRQLTGHLVGQQSPLLLLHVPLLLSSAGVPLPHARRQAHAGPPHADGVRVLHVQRLPPDPEPLQVPIV